MSVYQKFIDSALGSTSPQRAHSQQQFQQSHYHHQQQQQQQQQQQRQKFSNYSNAATQITMKPTAQVGQFMSKFSMVSSAAITSTPISKQQYKRLVEADQIVIARQHEHQLRREQQQQQQQQLCSSPCRLFKQHHNHNYQSNQQGYSHNHHHHHQQNQQQQQQQHQSYQCCRAAAIASPVDAFFKTDDPVLLKWLQAMRFETELECLTSLQARTLAIDEHSAGALSVRNSQVTIQEMRLDSNFILDYIDFLIETLPLKFSNLNKFSIEFSELWTKLNDQTAARTTNANQTYSTTLAANNHDNLTIINCTPRKSMANARTLKPLDDLAIKIRKLCMDLTNLLYEYQENSSELIDNGHLESSLRKLKELYGKFVEISIRAECANIVRALNYDFSKSSLNRLSSSSSLHPVRPFESSSSQLPLKWALIALWQLTNDDSYICRVLTEKWQTTIEQSKQQLRNTSPKSTVAKRLDYSTKYDSHQEATNSGGSSSIDSNSKENHNSNSLRSDYQKLYQICQSSDKFQQQQQQNNRLKNNKQYQSKPATENDENSRAGALSSAIKFRQQQPVEQVSTIEILINVIISQPNKHERLDMMNFIHSQAQQNKLIDLDEWDQNVSAAIYTSNQYKVAALRILNHLCVNEQAIKTILKCFSTPPPSQGQPMPENKIIRSIFECYQTSQEHIYQNETMFHTSTFGSAQRGRKRNHNQQFEDDEYSDYGSRQTNSILNSNNGDDGGEEGDDVVVKEAIRLLVQLTTSFHRSNQGLDFYTLIGRFSIESLVKYLTNIMKSTTSREMLFLSLTALANISFITTEPMKLYGTNRIMLELFRASKHRSKDLELRDQAVTILANTADKNLLDIVSNGGLNFLLSCLESCPTRMANYKQSMDRQRKDLLSSNDEGMNRLNIENKPRDRKPIDISDDFSDVLECACDQHNPQQSACLNRLSTNDLAAMERIHQKTAVAFARMSVDPSTTRMVLKYGGIKQMIDLCKFSHKRNHSDTVLIACIAALRKMARVIEKETFRYYNALDLIELELNQTLEIYGAPQKLFASDV